MEGLCFSFAMAALNNLEPLRFVVSRVVDSLEGSNSYVTSWEMKLCSSLTVGPSRCLKVGIDGGYIM